MIKVATLGPKGTYSELATLKYIESCNESHEIIYFSSIKKALASVNNTGDENSDPKHELEHDQNSDRKYDNKCDIVVLPIENFSEGFVAVVLDHVINSDLNIISEILLPIQFSLVSNMKDITKIDRLFVQFVAKGQCSEYIETLENVDIISTESNIESLNMVINDTCNTAAIVPSGSFNIGDFNTVVANVNDYQNNQTRFLAFSSKPKRIDNNATSNWKTSLVILDDHDRPGLLSDILTSFASRNINLTSIISRPTRIEFGRYNFLIDINGHSDDPLVSEAIKEVNRLAKVKNMGSYLVAEAL